MSKKKLIRIEPASWQKDLYVSYPKALVFAFVGAETKKDADGLMTKTQVTKLVGCRELLCADYRASLFNCERGTTSQVHVSTPVDTSALRLLIIVNNSKDMKNSNAEVKTRIFAAKRVLNLIESVSGFETSSVITSVKHKHSAYDGTAWLLTGAKEWVSAPQMLSLAALIFRVSYHIEGGLKSDNEKTLIEQITDLPYNSGGTSKYSSSEINDFCTLRGIKNYLFKITKLHKKLFYTAQEEAYGRNENKFTNNGYGGISSLMNCGTGDNSLNKKFKNLVLAK